MLSHAPLWLSEHAFVLSECFSWLSEFPLWLSHVSLWLSEHAFALSESRMMLSETLLWLSRSRFMLSGLDIQNFLKDFIWKYLFINKKLEENAP